MISRRAARRLIVLHPKQNTESELKWQTFSGMMPTTFFCSSGKGLECRSLKNIRAQMSYDDVQYGGLNN